MPGLNTYIFNDGDGSGTLTYVSGNDTIKFKDSKILDMRFNKNGNDFEIHYGTSDKLTLKNYKTSDDTIKIKDSTEREYTLRLGAGYNSTLFYSNSINVGATSRDVIRVSEIHQVKVLYLVMAVQINWADTVIKLLI